MNLESVFIGFLAGGSLGLGLGVLVTGTLYERALKRERMRCRGFAGVLNLRRLG